MSVGQDTVRRVERTRRLRVVRRELPWHKRLAYIATIYLVVFALGSLLAEIGFRLFWSPKYWIHTSRFLVGSGQTEAGKKWWPDTRYLVESSEFRTEFCTDARGYRARPAPAPSGDAYRIAFVGDSFTEAMQVSYEASFCARLEKLLGSAGGSSRAIVCENAGVSATDLLEYWHRIHHDVLANNPPSMIALCIYPGNDFSGPLPDDAFDSAGKPLPLYYHRPGWEQHLIAWVNMHSKFGSYTQRALLGIGRRPIPYTVYAPKNWWADPALAARSAAVPAVRRSRAILAAIDEECRGKGTKLCVLVVGPVDTYAAKDGESPLTRIISGWGLDIPVIDVAIKAVALPNHGALTFPIDGHLTESGHEYLAREAAPALAALIEPGAQTSRR
jgi:hypothetical protein